MTEDVYIKGLDESKVKLKALSAVTRSEKVMDSLEAGARVIQIHAMNNARNKLNKHPTGNLVNNINIKRRGRQVLVGVWGVVYAAIHEFGGVIVPIAAKALKFKTADGDWVTTKKVVIPARPYLRPAVDENMPAIEAAVTETMRHLLQDAVK